MRATVSPAWRIPTALALGSSVTPLRTPAWHAKTGVIAAADVVTSRITSAFELAERDHTAALVTVVSGPGLVGPLVLRSRHVPN